MNRLSACVLSVLLSGFAGCADDEAHDVPLPCDITERACQRTIFRATAAARGQSKAKMPPIRVISRDQLADELRAAVSMSSGELDPGEATQQRQGQTALSLLGLLPPPAMQSADDAYVEQSVATIAAYYSHVSHDVTVISDETEDRDGATITLSHEFVHALQDQREGLSGLRSDFVRSTDGDVALTSLIEGEATWLSLVTYAVNVNQWSKDRIDYEKTFARQLDATLSAIEKSSAPLIDMSELIPYPVGGRHVAELDMNDGLDAVRALFGAPPLTLRAWLPDPPAAPGSLPCPVPDAPDGYTRLEIDSLGAGGLLAFLSAQEVSGQDAYALASEWRADQIGFYASDADPEQVVVAWRLLVDSGDSARALADAASASGSVTAVTAEENLLLVAATDAPVLDDWQPSALCDDAQKSRALPASGRLQVLRRRLGIFR